MGSARFRRTASMGFQNVLAVDPRAAWSRDICDRLIAAHGSCQEREAKAFVREPFSLPSLTRFIARSDSSLHNSNEATMKSSIPALAAALTLTLTSGALAQSSPMPMSSMSPMPMASMSPIPMASVGPSITVKLNPENNSGETASAVLTPVSGGTTVSVKTSGGPMTAQPIHIHKGTCAKLDPKPAYPLTTLMNASSTTFLKGVTPAQLTASPYAINIHKSPTEAATYVACGEIEK